MNCPKCGATPTYSGEYGVHFQCDSELLLQYPFVESGTSFREDKCCLYRQLAAVTAERDALLAAAKAARGELVLLGKDLQEIEDRIRFRPSCLLSDETLAEIDAAIAQAEGTQTTSTKEKGCEL